MRALAAKSHCPEVRSPAARATADHLQKRCEAPPQEESLAYSDAQPPHRWRAAHLPWRLVENLWSLRSFGRPSTLAAADAWIGSRPSTQSGTVASSRRRQLSPVMGCIQYPVNSCWAWLGDVRSRSAATGAVIRVQNIWAVPYVCL